MKKWFKKCKENIKGFLFLLFIGLPLLCVFLFGSALYNVLNWIPKARRIPI